MPHNSYDGLPAAANFEQSIVLAQLIILRDLERRNKRIAQESQQPEAEIRPAA